MRGAVFVAVAAAIGNLLQGWDNSVIAGMYHKSYVFYVFNHLFLVLIILLILYLSHKMLQDLFFI